MTGMNLELYLAFVAASTILIVIPGPNVLLVISTALKDGVRPALLTVAGTSSAMVLQLTVAVGGLTSLVLVLSEWFEILRWVGVIYLAYLGVQTLREKPAGTAAGAPPKAADRVPFARGFLVSLTNPKTLLFFAAFLLQFVDASLPPAHQLLVLAIHLRHPGDDAQWQLCRTRQTHLARTPSPLLSHTLANPPQRLVAAGCERRSRVDPPVLRVIERSRSKGWAC